MAYKTEVKLTHVEADHIIFCMKRYKENGWWGNKKQFTKRHERIVSKLIQCL